LFAPMVKGWQDSSINFARVKPQMRHRALRKRTGTDFSNDWKTAPLEFPILGNMQRV
jgi:hypothetical protein